MPDRVGSPAPCGENLRALAPFRRLAARAGDTSGAAGVRLGGQGTDPLVCAVVRERVSPAAAAGDFKCCAFPEGRFQGWARWGLVMKSCGYETEGGGRSAVEVRVSAGIRVGLSRRSAAPGPPAQLSGPHPGPARLSNSRYERLIYQQTRSRASRRLETANAIKTQRQRRPSFPAAELHVAENPGPPPIAISTLLSAASSALKLGQVLVCDGRWPEAPLPRHIEQTRQSPDRQRASLPAAQCGTRLAHCMQGQGRGLAAPSVERVWLGSPRCTRTGRYEVERSRRLW